MEEVNTCWPTYTRSPHKHVPRYDLLQVMIATTEVALFCLTRQIGLISVVEFFSRGTTQYRQSHNGFAAFRYRFPAPLCIVRGHVDPAGCGVLNSCMIWVKYGLEFHPDYSRVVFIYLSHCRHWHKHALAQRPNLAERVNQLRAADPPRETNNREDYNMSANIYSFIIQLYP